MLGTSTVTGQCKYLTTIATHRFSINVFIKVWVRQLVSKNEDNVRLNSNCVSHTGGAKNISGVSNKQ